MSVLSWLSANWQSVLLAVLAVDSALIPLFPQIGILGKIKVALSGVVPPKA